MRALTSQETLIFNERMGALGRWADFQESKITTQRIWSRASVDDDAKSTLLYFQNFYRAILIEPRGDRNPHHLVTDTAWGYFREAMRLSPATVYDKLGSALTTLYSPTGLWRSSWYRPVIAADGTIAMTQTPDEDVPGHYRTVTDKQVLDFLQASGGRIIPLETIPDPYPPLTFSDIELTAEIGTSHRIDLEALGGRTPYTYSVITSPGDIMVRVVSSTLLLSASSGSLTPGRYVGTLRATDDRGITADAELVVTLTAASP